VDGNAHLIGAALDRTMTVVTSQPSKARTCGRRGHPPVVRVCGKGSGRVSVAGLACMKPGQGVREVVPRMAAVRHLEGPVGIVAYPTVKRIPGWRGTPSRDFVVLCYAGS